ncbi:tetratricopeptide repeat protein [Pseudomonas sp. o96-267]|uniref:tetratricopeptide repeat protein n=1 Tax=Pseudomonas sp. o96-267 TaxID=2479853 RepID=UPI001C497D78|nr:tetratricopeptide repeat protein [Pseudomonas sp. o96-267]
MRVISLLLASLLLGGCTTLTIPGGDLIALQEQADQAYAKGDYPRATLFYERLAKSLPTDADTRYRLGNSLARQGQNHAAIEAYREALVRDGNHARAWYNLMQVQTREVLLTAGEAQQHLNAQSPQSKLAFDQAVHVLNALSPQQE